MMSRTNRHILAVVLLTTLITYLHFGSRQFSPNVILEELFYLPLLLGGILFWSERRDSHLAVRVRSLPAILFWHLDNDISAITGQGAAPCVYRGICFRRVLPGGAKAESKGVTVSMHLPSAQITTLVDGFHIERALVNLIDNAVDASQSGATVNISVATDRNTLTITIKDQGSGMDSETLASLFMPFYTTKNEGTGLGMSISKKVVEAHSGTLDIRSEKEVGTEATIRLPCK